MRHAIREFFFEELIDSDMLTIKQSQGAPESALWQAPFWMLFLWRNFHPGCTFEGARADAQ